MSMMSASGGVAATELVVTVAESESPEDGGAASDGASGPNGREARNLAEKHRRDKVNASIQELATMVPHVAEATRRLDKTAVLRFATHGLRLQYVFGKAASKNEHQQQSLPLLTDALLQLLDSFFITLTCHGQIVLVSSSVEQLLGHCQSDLYGQNILQITHPEDQEALRQQLIPRDMDALFRSSSWHEQQHGSDVFGASKNSKDDAGGPNCMGRATSPHSEEHNDDDIDRRLRADRRCFIVRLARSAIRSEAARQYECVKIDGCFRRSDCSNTAGSFPIVSQLIRRSRSGINSGNMNNGSGQQGGVAVGGLNSPPNFLQHDVIAQAALHGISGNDVVLVAMARIIRPPRITSRVMEPNQLEYRTRHLIDGRIIDCDQRIGLVAGYMKDEVRNLSPFSFIHLDDVRWVIVALRQMYDCNSDYGESCYRLISRNGHFIYLQTKGYLEIDKKTNKVHSFVCVNTLLDEVQGRRKVQEMKDKFSAIIKTKIPSSSLHDVPASQNPQQLERIVLYLIENLQQQQTPAQHMLNNVSNNKARTETSRCSSVTPPPHPAIALVPPEPASVRNSITRSVSVVNITAAKNLSYWQHSSPTASYQGSSEASLSPASSCNEDTTTMDTQSYGARNTATPTSSALHVLRAARSTPQNVTNVNLSTPSHTPDSSPGTPPSMMATGQAATPPLSAATVATAAPPLGGCTVSALKRLHGHVPMDYCDEASDSTSPAKRATSAATSPRKTATTISKAIARSLCQKQLLKRTVISRLASNGNGNSNTNTNRNSNGGVKTTSPATQAIDHKLGAIMFERQHQQATVHAENGPSGGGMKLLTNLKANPAGYTRH